MQIEIRTKHLNARHLNMNETDVGISG